MPTIGTREEAALDTKYMGSQVVIDEFHVKPPLHFKMELKTVCLALVPILFRHVLSAPAGSGPPTVTVDSGSVVGIQTTFPGSDVIVNKYLGIPFAAPPVRFEPPVPPAPWSSPYDASKYGPACIQQFTSPVTEAFYNNPPPAGGESEDCLNLNVYAPVDASGEGKPVMFWIYGVCFSIKS